MPENYIINQTEKGNVCISEEVIGLMVSAALNEVDGVAGLSNPTALGSDLAGFFGIKNSPKGIKVTSVPGKAVIDLLILVRYGYNVADAARRVQRSVSASIEGMTGMETVVNVHVTGISFEKAEIK